MTFIPSYSKPDKFYVQKISTPLGSMLAIADDNYLYWLSFINDLKQDSFEDIPKYYHEKILFQTNTILDNLKKELEAYFKSQLKSFNIPLKLVGTDFQKQAWQELLKIPYGKTISYLEQAQNIGKAKAYRAVANANGKNPISIIVPCHRVINANGKLGGYTGGINKKIFLLNCEDNAP
ncbi:methylated-DNA--[protein]-cysteine S-methyltransferase [Allofrancisella guangzhouensis]|uniref:methylated-DNA--[protein]-cysteine S-methyltransferase n=1 Tax=Allofrancisella guangzhouensis TaxID=594679 RepID=UPI002453B8DF|nr:methylated-DNA--[protein]-cysteine S-methyltransferase [Allofrancisella guangzhouensis]